MSGHYTITAVVPFIIRSLHLPSICAVDSKLVRRRAVLVSCFQMCKICRSWKCFQKCLICKENKKNGLSRMFYTVKIIF